MILIYYMKHSNQLLVVLKVKLKFGYVNYFVKNVHLSALGCAGQCIDISINNSVIAHILHWMESYLYEERAIRIVICSFSPLIVPV